MIILLDGMGNGVGWGGASSSLSLVHEKLTKPWGMGTWNQDIGRDTGQGEQSKEYTSWSVRERVLFICVPITIFT